MDIPKTLSFWQKLAKPFTLLAPMEGVTDPVFRRLISIVGKPDVFFTEFVSATGLVSRGKPKITEHLQYSENEKPIVVQLFGEIPDKFAEAAKIVSQMGFAGIDINMGCPDRTVMKLGGGAKLINNWSLAKEIIQAVMLGSNGLPVSVKTRCGYSEIDLEWIKFLLEQKLSAITIHFRTYKELFSGPVHWELAQEVKIMRDQISPQTTIIGNGDIQNYTEVLEKYKLYGIEGYMIGRGAIINPWVFNTNYQSENLSPKDKFQMFIKHIELFEEIWPTGHNAVSLRKFASAYIGFFSGSAKYRAEFMLQKTTAEMKLLLKKWSAEF